MTDGTSVGVFWVEHMWPGGSAGELGPGGPLGSRFLVTVRLLPLGLDGEREAGHSSQRQVAQCKQLIVAEELL
ncbi:hypothetical protein VZT92_013618 [Zoarces viviparus]|uniref:Uncharacterized protein n=1 Tax=Zoarces viviparus TaxID=48416 RepID=A0AAW1F4I2_ZOAVI